MKFIFKKKKNDKTMKTMILLINFSKPSPTVTFSHLITPKLSSLKPLTASQTFLPSQKPSSIKTYGLVPSCLKVFILSKTKSSCQAWLR